MLTQSLFPVFMFAFIFHCRSFSLCWPLVFLIFSPPLAISMFFFLQNSSPLKKTRLGCCLFFLKVRGGACDFLPVAFGLPYLLIELFYIGMPVVRTDGRAGGRSVYGHVITKFFGWVNYFIFSYPWCSAGVLRARGPAIMRLLHVKFMLLSNCGTFTVYHIVYNDIIIIFSRNIICMERRK